jgi:hypothetical protein
LSDPFNGCAIIDYYSFIIEPFLLSMLPWFCCVFYYYYPFGVTISFPGNYMDNVNGIGSLND